MNDGHLGARHAPSLAASVLAGLLAAAPAARAACPPDVGPGETASLVANQVISTSCTVAATGVLDMTSGSPTISSTGSLDLRGIAINSVLRNSGLVTTRAGSEFVSYLRLDNQAGGRVLVGGVFSVGGNINNLAGALFSIQPGATMQAAGSTFNNYGTLRFEADAALGDTRYGQVNSYAGSTLENLGRMTLAVGQYNTASDFVNGPGAQLTVAAGRALSVGSANFTNQAGGTVQVEGRLQASLGTSVITNAGVLRFQQEGSASFLITSASNFLNQAGGTVEFGLASQIKTFRLFDNAAGATVRSIYALDGTTGEIRNAGSLYLLSGADAARFTQSAGGTWTSGGITAGTVRFDGGVLGGSASVSETADDRRITFAAGAALAPSTISFDLAETSPFGLLTMRNDLACQGCALQLDVAGVETARHDMVRVQGQAVLGAGSRLEMSFIDGYTPRAGDRFELLATTQGLTMEGMPDVTIAGVQQGFRYTLFNDNGVLTMVALNDALPVPEPASAWMAAAGLLALVARRRRVRGAVAALSDTARP